MPDWKQAFTGWGLSWDGWLHNRRGEWWLLGQLILIATHLAPAWPAPDAFGVQWPSPLRLIGLMVLMLGLALALQGFLTLGASLSPFPIPNREQRSSRKGCIGNADIPSIAPCWSVPSAW